MLDHVGAPADVDLNTVRIESVWGEAYRHSEHTEGGGNFSVNIQWKEKTPRESSPYGYPERPDEQGLYRRSVELLNEEVAQFLGTLESPE